MDYIKGNKEAWEEAYENRVDGWGETVVENLQNKTDFYIQPCIKKILDQQDLKGKQIAQFCCNNGRELLSIVKHYEAEGTGFDIAENLIAQAKQHTEALNLPCTFIAENLLDITSKYDQKFDLILFTIGAITWFKDLDELFHVVSRCLKQGGTMILHDIHPFMNMLPLPGEEGFSEGKPMLLQHKYFTDEPWIENNGMGYISGDYESKTFISFSHSLSEIFTATLHNDMEILQFQEFDYDVGLSDAYDHQGLPLSILLYANKK